MRRVGALAVTLALAATIHGCADLYLVAFNLEIGPDPARPGDAVQFFFHLGVVPTQPYTVVAIVNGTEYTSVSETEARDGPFVFDVGDAGNLIERYGTGTHRAYVEVRLTERNRTARTEERSFELQPPEAVP